MLARQKIQRVGRRIRHYAAQITRVASSAIARSCESGIPCLSSAGPPLLQRSGGLSGVPNAMHLGHPFQWKNTLPWHLGPAAKVRILRFKIFRHSGMILVFKTTFEVFTRVGPDNSLERLTERSVGLVTDQPSDVYELFVTLL